MKIIDLIRKKFSQTHFSQTKLVFLVAIYLVSIGNFSFAEKVLEIYPWGPENFGFLISLWVLLYAMLVLVMTLFRLVITTRLVISAFIFMTVLSAYFADQFGTVIDINMIQNIIETDINEAGDLLNPGLLLSVLLFGIIPVVLVFKISVHNATRLRELRYKAQTVVCSVVIMGLCIGGFGDHYASFIREHKPLRYYANPIYPLYSVGKYLVETTTAVASVPTELFQTLPTATIPATDTERELIILVVGETARRDKFSLNGYARNTNPELAKEKNLVSYSNISSCGTSTSVSVPCMFSQSGREQFDKITAKYTENILDVLARTGVSVLWRENNTGSKGVADRIKYENFTASDLNPVCDIECRDVGMLHGLQGYIDSKSGDILIVLHQMGNHGPAYFKRYPPEFERFKPACQSKELSSCSDQEITNAYDNAILYTDYFLSQVIAFLKKNTPVFETAMLYVSDHGESLGENGLYLHGMPYLFAPKQQTEVPLIVWVGDSSDIDLISALTYKNKTNSHDALFDSLLAAFEVDTDSKESASPLYNVRESDGKH